MRHVIPGYEVPCHILQPFLVSWASPFNRQIRPHLKLGEVVFHKAQPGYCPKLRQLRLGVLGGFSVRSALLDDNLCRLASGYRLCSAIVPSPF
jgi:hypothetical protein